MAEITIIVCDVCRSPVGNRIAIRIDGRLICRLECGDHSVGRERYWKAWIAECTKRLAAISNKPRISGHEITILKGGEHWQDRISK